MTDFGKRQQVYEILMMPIVCDDRKRKNLERRDRVILSGQKYCSSFIDEDMSDFAVCFYEILYGYLWDNHSMLDEKGALINWEFAGDTMNSFNTIANAVPGAGDSRDLRTPEEEWPEYLRTYYHTYHCLANFWILPMETGRMLKGKLNKARTARDFMDRYLNVIRDGVEFNGMERDYHNRFSGWDDFITKHFLFRGYLSDDGMIKPISRGSAEEFTKNAICAMEGRAKEISESDYANELWELFNKNGLIL